MMTFAHLTAIVCRSQSLLHWDQSVSKLSYPFTHLYVKDVEEARSLLKNFGLNAGLFTQIC